MLNIDNQLRRLIGVLATAQDYVYRAQAVPVWTSADGRVTPITEMDDTWLRNAIGVVERGVARSPRTTRVLPAMRAELARRKATEPKPAADGTTVAMLAQDHRGLLRRVQILERNEHSAATVDHAIGEALKRTRDLREWFEKLQSTFDSARALMCQRCEQTERRLAALELSARANDANDTRLHARLEAVEAVAHKPQPVVAHGTLRAAFQAMADALPTHTLAYHAARRALEALDP